MSTIWPLKYTPTRMLERRKEAGHAGIAVYAELTRRGVQRDQTSEYRARKLGKCSADCPRCWYGGHFHDYGETS